MGATSWAKSGGPAPSAPAAETISTPTAKKRDLPTTSLSEIQFITLEAGLARDVSELQFG